ncbi:hypothetical protein [Prosthecobacter fusiformis]|nr:hypothetical protein [Prosthecobacter fusiformis]
MNNWLLWLYLLEQAYWWLWVILLTGCFLAFFKSQRRLVGWIGWTTAAIILVPYCFLFREGISVGISSREELKYIIAVVLPPLVSITLIFIGRRKLSAPQTE